MAESRLFLIFILLLFQSCISESEKIINQKIEEGTLDFTKLNRSFENLKYKYDNDLQYGLIELRNGEQIKFWFVSHHQTSDIGGTLYEFPDGKKDFIKGYHCCEIQFPEHEKDFIFKNSQTFKSFVREKDGISP